MASVGAEPGRGPGWNSGRSVEHVLPVGATTVADATSLLIVWSLVSVLDPVAGSRVRPPDHQAGNNNKNDEHDQERHLVFHGTPAHQGKAQ